VLQLFLPLAGSGLNGRHDSKLVGVFVPLPRKITGELNRPKKGIHSRRS
jgi:hypothetical protein